MSLFLSMISFLFHLFAFSAAAVGSWVVFRAIWDDTASFNLGDKWTAVAVVAGMVSILVILGNALIGAAPVSVTF